MSFPDTRLSLLDALGSDDGERRERAADAIARVYRDPIIAVLRLRWSLAPDDAEDLAQEFLAQAFTRDWLQRYDPARGRFRTFLRSCLAHFASDARDAAGRLKRGGGSTHVSIDDLAGDVPASDPEVDALFEREWARSVLAQALERLRAECDAAGRASTYAVFVDYDVDGAQAGDGRSYADVAARHGLPVTQVTNYLNWARRRFRAHTLDTLRALTASDAEFRDEARALLGVTIP